MDTEVAAGINHRVLAARAEVPSHVVFRSFVAETVILNLETGRYHGANAVGGTMLEALEASDAVRDAARSLAATFSRPEDEMQRDLVEFCADLEERGLIVLTSPDQR